MRRLRYLWLILVVGIGALGCSEDGASNNPPLVVSSSPRDGDTDVLITTEVSVSYDQAVRLSENHGIKINGQSVEATAQGAKIELSVNLVKGADYIVKIPVGAVLSVDGVGTKSELLFDFSTEGKASEISASPVVANASPETVKVYSFLREVYGSKCLSGAMANVSWNTNEADWVYKHTGKYPAMNTFDYIHLHWSPDPYWIDYSNIEPIEDWWANNGIVSAMWHWNVPNVEGQTDNEKFTFRPWETSFRAANATVEGTWENEIVKADLKEMAGYLKLLQEKNIPVVWRPLHEAAGNTYKGGGAWFWWGADGAEAYKKLWIQMFEYFEEQGLNNIIWVWTTEIGDEPFYPGDEYVDIVARDIYGVSDATSIANQFKAIQEAHPTKMVALSELGGVATISNQWKNNAKWSFFMPWYDYDRTVNPGSSAFESTAHGNANVTWWKDAFVNDVVVSRDELPIFK
jgi:mannan endo-1,4-beta-mannosidase